MRPVGHLHELLGGCDVVRPRPRDVAGPHRAFDAELRRATAGEGHGGALLVAAGTVAATAAGPAGVGHV